MKIRPLAHVPECIPTLARWFHREWHAFDGRAIPNIAAQLCENTGCDGVPVTFIALKGRAGIGTALVQHAQEFAFAHAIGRLYLWTPGSTRLYEKCGWTILQRSTYNSHLITLMHRANGFPETIPGQAVRR